MTDLDIFLSHNGADKASVESIGHKLETEGPKPWLDKWCLVAGQPWQHELATVLRSCPTMGVFIGQNGLGDWVRDRQQY